ncbi:hypothetical protein JTE90_001406 [Oedothorax gibbosus]|uniref:NADH dehydrogenase [ubiquinone] 1 subunit C2 n=1 Tax=Oedothorax gibbosus TaxID=931172 RepID=A0AAV6VHG5_9ARAC|nr:hypothetical protein JTE90_001406 [Oedothorax gibbosus]
MGLQKDSLFSRYFYPVTFAFMGAITPAINNYAYRKPYHAGIQRHIALGVAGWLFGMYAESYMTKKWAHRDAVIKHYIELHPEDFVDERRKYKEVFEPWQPAR